MVHFFTKMGKMEDLGFGTSYEDGLHGDYFKTGHPSFSLNNTLESKNLHYSQIAEDFPNSERCITFL